MKKKIAVLAVQGAFIEHERILTELGAECIELRKSDDLKNDFAGLVLPGGESTVQSKLVRELGMYDALKEKIDGGIPVLATCAGLILLAEQLEGSNEKHFATLPVTVKRNAYGRQLGSFSANAPLAGDETSLEFPLEFIRAPYICGINNQAVEKLVVIDRLPDGTKGENVVGLKYNNQIALAFHPELTCDYRLHQMFLDLVD